MMALAGSGQPAAAPPWPRLLTNCVAVGPFGLLPRIEFQNSSSMHVSFVIEFEVTRAGAHAWDALVPSARTLTSLQLRETFAKARFELVPCATPPLIVLNKRFADVACSDGA